MAVTSNVVGRTKPGRYEDFLSQALEVTKLYERLGAGTSRLFAAGIAGEAFGTWTFASEFDSMEHYGTFSDALSTDAEWQALMLRLQQPDNPVTLEQVNLCVEIPTGRTHSGGRGAVLVSNASRPSPGALEEAIALGIRACAFVERHGAVSARLFNLVAAGLGAGMMLSTWEFANLRALGKAYDAWSTDPEGQAIASEAAGRDAPLTMVWDGIYNQIPI